MHTGLTVSPGADTAGPAARMLRAALTSRSWLLPHSGQLHCRTLNGMAGMTCPHSLHRLLDGYQRSMQSKVRPCQRALYSSCLTNSDQPASLMDLARRRFFCMLAIARLSMAITWLSLINRLESWCRKSRHKCSSLVCTLFLRVICITGLPLVFHEELEHLLDDGKP